MFACIHVHVLTYMTSCTSTPYKNISTCEFIVPQQPRLFLQELSNHLPDSRNDCINLLLISYSLGVKYTQQFRQPPSLQLARAPLDLSSSSHSCTIFVSLFTLSIFLGLLCYTVTKDSQQKPYLYYLYNSLHLNKTRRKLEV